jgi:hypothetical protein
MMTTTTTNTTTTTAVPTADEVARQSAADRIANWWPKGMTPTSPEPADVAFTRAVVGAVPSFRHAKDAGALLGTCVAFARWLVATNQALDPRTAFAPEHLDAYLAGPLAGRPQGSKDAAMSLLRRMAATAPSVSMETEADAGTPAVESVEDVLASFAPSTVDAARFAVVADLVRSAAWDCNPTTVARAKLLVRNATYLAAWVDACGLPVRRDVVFHPDTVEEFAALLATALPTSSAGTIASSLRTMSRTLFPPLSAKVRTRLGRAVWSNPPYGTAEVDSLFTFASRAFSAKRRRHFGLLLCMGLGTGANGGEMGLARLEDVGCNQEGRTTLALRTALDPARTRTIVMLDAYAELFGSLVAEAAADGDIWLLGAGGMRRNRASGICEDTLGKWAPELDIFRLRNTYLLALVETRQTALELLDAAGLTRLESLDAVVRCARVAADVAADVAAEGDDGEQAR